MIKPIIIFFTVRHFSPLRFPSNVPKHILSPFYSNCTIIILSRFYLLILPSFPKGKFGQFWKLILSPKTPAKINVHALHIHPYLHEFMSRFRQIKFFHDLQSMGRRGNLAVFESSNISETGEVMPTKIGVHVCYINTYLHEFFEPIPIN